MMFKILRMRWLLNRRTGFALLCFLGLGAVAFMVNVVGIRVAGDTQGWTVWLKDHAPLFLMWRMVLYIGVVIGWIWMRKRVLRREKQEELSRGQEARQRLIRIEIAAVVVLLVLEVSNALA